MTRSQNGWSVCKDAGSQYLHVWLIPARNGNFSLRIRRGPGGLLLAHLALWYAETVEKVAGKVLDDWGYAYRPIRGQSTGYSNHASGTAIDLNATKHPLAKVGTFGRGQIPSLRGRLRWALYGGAIRWGGDYHGRKDEMHFELVKPVKTVRPLARALAKTPRGRRLLAVNPSQKEFL
ncbi:MAG: hypothetical protein JWO46_1791 [Nocardioidaceae bacterium]|nr:hypothetical protein [Nocardioidaceae bacterium]